MLCTGRARDVFGPASRVEVEGPRHEARHLLVAQPDLHNLLTGRRDKESGEKGGMRFRGPAHVPTHTIKQAVTDPRVTHPCHHSLCRPRRATAPRPLTSPAPLVPVAAPRPPLKAFWRRELNQTKRPATRVAAWGGDLSAMRRALRRQRFEAVAPWVFVRLCCLYRSAGESRQKACSRVRDKQEDVAW